MRLTRYQRQVLVWMRDNSSDGDDPDTDLVYEEGGGWWCGDRRVSSTTAHFLIRNALVSADEMSRAIQRHTINECGKRAIEGLQPYRNGDGQYFDSLDQLISATAEKEQPKP